MKQNYFKAGLRYDGICLRNCMVVGVSLLFMFLVSCGNNNANNKDSVDSAMNVNDQKVGNNITPVDTSDADFVVKAANGGMAEVELGKIAKQKATSANVKEFASKMVEDHSKINDRLKAVAASLNITIPAAIDKEKQDAVDKLNATAVTDFDKDYMDMMVKAHNNDVDLFQKAAKDISNPDLHSFITEALPTLQAHQKMAKQMDDKLK